MRSTSTRAAPPRTPARRGDDTDKFLLLLTYPMPTMGYKGPKFWIMLEKEFKDDKDKLVSWVGKYDCSSGSLFLSFHLGHFPWSSLYVPMRGRHRVQMSSLNACWYVY